VAQISARRAALAALRAWRTKKQFADAIIADARAETKLHSADRAFALELFYGVLRNLTLLDSWIGALRSGPVEADLRDILQLGLYQLFIAKTPEHAAVYETVDLAPKRQRPIVNALLRSAVRSNEELRKKAKTEPLHVRTSHPQFLIERWENAFGKEATAALCDWNNKPPPIYARINRLKIERLSFLKRYRTARNLPNISNFVELPSPANALEAGDCYVQDPSTAIACELLQPQPGEKILDACAAPGGKTGYLAELMENRGSLFACDRERDRLHLLEENLSRLDVRIRKIVRQDWTISFIAKEIQAPFDRILVDAPCTNTGVMRRRVDVRWRLRAADFTRMQKRQIEIVRAVLPLLKPDGILVYSTCSLEREENEDVVRALLEEMSTRPPERGRRRLLQLEEERRSLPFIDHFDGAFAARFRRIT
jgi:16S rRNA (cytosine967-C5)-methyltransferase